MFDNIRVEFIESFINIHCKENVPIFLLQMLKNDIHRNGDIVTFGTVGQNLDTSTRISYRTTDIEQSKKFIKNLIGEFSRKQ